MFGVDREIGNHRLGEGELVIVDVDGTDFHAQYLGILDGRKSEATGAQDDDPLSRPGPGFLAPL